VRSSGIAVDRHGFCHSVSSYYFGGFPFSTKVHYTKGTRELSTANRPKFPFVRLKVFLLPTDAKTAIMQI
jgi:hypothetical protein